MKTFIMFTLCLNLFGLAAVDEIENGRAPKGDTVTMKFTEELRIDGESGEDIHFWTGATVAVEVDDRGHMFVADTGGNRIIEFDTEGELVRQIGQKGEGPGEFQFLKSFKIFQDGTAIAYDDLLAAAVFSHYDKDIKYKNKKKINATKRSLESITFSPDGKHISAFYMTFEKGVTMTHTGLLSRKLEPTIELTKKPVANFDPNQVTKPSWWSEFYSKWFNICAQGLGMAIFDEKGNVYTAITSKYEITRWDSNLKKNRVITRDYKPIIQTSDDLMAFSDPIRGEILSSLPASLHQYITPKVVEKAIEMAGFPPHKQPIFGMVPMEDGGLLVVHDFNPVTGKTVADIFSSEGKFVGQADLPKVSVNIFGSFFGNSVKMILKNGRAYIIEINEDGEPSLVRYKYEVKPT